MPPTPIFGPPTATKTQALNYWRERYAEKSKYDEATVSEIFDTYFWVCEEEGGMNPILPIGQSLNETGGYTFLTGAGVPPLSGYGPDQWNFAGIGTTGPGVEGEWFETIEDGVRAHVRRLRLYAVSHPALYDLDILQRELPEAYWGVITYVEDLGGPISAADPRVKWAVSPMYGQRIASYMGGIAVAPDAPDEPSEPSEPPVADEVFEPEPTRLSVIAKFVKWVAEMIGRILNSG